MAKLLTLVVAAVLLAATMANASTYTVTTTVEEDGMLINQQGRECEREIQQQRQQLRHCEQYLSEQSMGGEGGQQYFARAIMNQIPEQMQHFSLCCQALQNIGDQQCVCQSLERIASSGSSGRGESAPFEMIRASDLPLFCGLGHTCQFGSSS